jgi:hypothetical protein
MTITSASSAARGKVCTCLNSKTLKLLLLLVAPSFISGNTRTQAAVSAMGDAIAYHLGDPSADHFQMAVQRDEEGDLLGAISSFRAEARFRPSSEIFNNLGVALLELPNGTTEAETLEGGQPATALECFELALDIDPANQDAITNLKGCSKGLKPDGEKGKLQPSYQEYSVDTTATKGGEVLHQAQIYKSDNTEITLIFNETESLKRVSRQMGRRYDINKAEWPKLQAYLEDVRRSRQGTVRLEDAVGEFMDVGKAYAIAKKHWKSYDSNPPFPHIVLDNFFPSRLLHLVAQEAAATSSGRGVQWDSMWRDPLNDKMQLSNFYKQGPWTQKLITALRSTLFVSFLESMTGIPGLIPDPHSKGGGLHHIPRGGFLKVHADFNRHHHLRLDRRVNVFVYLVRVNLSLLLLACCC